MTGIAAGMGSGPPKGDNEANMFLPNGGSERSGLSGRLLIEVFRLAFPFVSRIFRHALLPPFSAAPRGEHHWLCRLTRKCRTTTLYFPPFFMRHGQQSVQLKDLLVFSKKLAGLFENGT